MARAEPVGERVRRACDGGPVREFGGLEARRLRMPELRLEDYLRRLQRRLLLASLQHCACICLNYKLELKYLF